MSPLLGFFARSLLLFALFLALWYGLRQSLAAPVRDLSWAAISRISPGLVTNVERTSDGLEFVTTVRQVTGEREGLFVVAVNPLIYGYGLPLFLALMLAARSKALWWKLPLGALLLFLPQVFGVVMDFLNTFVTRVPAPQVVAAGLFSWKREMIAFGYQLGALILPVVTPAVLWVLMNRTFVYGVILDGALADKKQDDLPTRQDMR